MNGLQNGATSTVTVSDAKTSSSTVIVTGGGATSTVLALGDPYAVTATTSASGYTVATSTDCAGTSFAAGKSCVVTFAYTAPQADISISKVLDNTSTPRMGDVAYYTLTATNLSSSTTAIGVMATDTWPSADLTFLSATSSYGTYVSGTGIWNVSNLAPSATATLMIAGTVTAPAGTLVTNAAMIGENSSTTDPNSGNNVATIRSRWRRVRPSRRMWRRFLRRK